MARYELQDGRVLRFWEVGRVGQSVTFRFGVVGESEGTRSRDHRTQKAAIQAVELGIAAMIGQGYFLVVQATAAVHDETEVFARLLEDPTDTGALQVHSDLLQSQGDPRGVVLAEALAGLDVSERLEADLEQLAGPLRSFPGEAEWTWRNGYLRTLSLTAPRSRAEQASATQVGLQILAHPGCGLLEELELRDFDPIVLATAELPALRVLGVSEHHRPSRRPLPLRGLGDRLPRLHTLVCHNVRRLQGALPPHVRNLAIEYLPPWLEVLGAVQLQRLSIGGLGETGLESLASSGVLMGVCELELRCSVDTVLGALREVCPPVLVLHDVTPVVRLIGLLGSPRLERLLLHGEPSLSDLEKLAESGITIDGDFRPGTVVAEPMVEPPLPSCSLTQYEIADRDHQKFWEIGRDGSTLHVRFGKIGTRGQRRSKVYASERDAIRAVETRTAKKLRKGYSKVEITIRHEDNDE